MNNFENSCLNMYYFGRSFILHDINIKNSQFIMQKALGAIL